MFFKKNWLPITVFIVALAGVGLYFLQTRPPKDPIIIYKTTPVEREAPPKPPPPGETHESGHWHGDEWHAGPHDAHAPAEVATPEVPGVPVDVSESEVSSGVRMFGGLPVSEKLIGEPPPRDYSKGAGNPSPFENVPVDLRDFEATKATMIENINFVKANWHPFKYNREVNIADAITHNISNAANARQLGLFTPEQALELTMLYADLLDFQGIERGRIPQLMDEGYTRDEAGRIASEETLQRQKQRWGVK